MNLIFVFGLSKKFNLLNANICLQDVEHMQELCLTQKTSKKQIQIDKVLIEIEKKRLLCVGKGGNKKIFKIEKVN